MARLIQKTGFIGRKSAGGYMKYIATREGVEVLTGKGPATEKQKEMVSKLLKDFPDMRDSFEYEDYKQVPTLHTASALISAALDTHMQNLQSENGYLRYIATRPGAEKHGTHGLFGREDNADLNAAMRDLTAHDGNVWTIIYSLHREDTERLGYNNAAAWRKLLISQQNKFAEAFHVTSENIHWYAAYHDADTHPHIHMMVWTDQKTVLKRDAVVKLRSAMTNSIFQAELENLYIQKDAAYKDVTEAARTAMHGLVDRLESIENPPESIQRKLLELAMELRSISGKKQYGYLKKPLKDKVDEIVDELEKLPEVAAYYSVWNGVRDTLEGYYKNRPRQHNPLSQQKEFRAIKNAIIQEAERLRQQMEQAQTAAEQKPSQDEEPSAEKTSTDASTNPTLADENTSSTPSRSVWLPSEYLLNSTVRLFHQMGRIFRDNAAPPSNPMGIRVDSKRRKKLMQKRLAMGHKQDDHEQEQGYNQTLH
ncbi:MAG: restriction endonuclease [Firmicutes bacterium]|nr:restriction endonuclease [Bacillota bacterium]